MRCVRFVGRTSAFSRFGSALTAALLFALALDTRPAFAIPSPELVVGSLSSISQLVALVSALLGGGALAMGARASRRGGQQASPWPSRLALGFAAVFMISVGVNVWQYTSYNASVQQRLESTLTRPTPRGAGGQTLDVALKEVSYSDQMKHPRGLSTGEIEALLKSKERGENSPYFMMDIRETAESEMGTMPGSTIVRYPDIASTKIDFKGKIPILFCHNGNRGFETCEALAKQGIDCRFMVGGLEKWLVEQRTLTGMNARTLDDLRALASFRNQTTLLDTPDVKRLIEQEGAVFVDVRYPGEFRSGALPGAINLPFRPTPTPQLKKMISELPKRPIIVPCYDRRSCFFGEVLGLELDRAGLDFRGRYTLPWEYFIPSTPRPYLQQWLDEAGKSYWTRAGDWLASVLSSLANSVGLILAIVIFALISRFLVLPFSVKAERDQMKARETKDEFETIKTQFKGDPPRQTRAIRAFYRRHGMTPMRNLIALLFLPVMALALVAVQSVATSSGAGFLWIANLAERDEWMILPIAFGVLITLYIDHAFATTRKKRIWIWALAFPLLTATGALLSAGADIYLVASAVLLLIQRAWVTAMPAKAIKAWRHRGLGSHIVELNDTSMLTGHGNKAYRLSRMRTAGMPVPDGVLLTPAFVNWMADATSDDRKRVLDRIWHRLGQKPLAVRSSAASEDGAGQSFAGVFESVIDVDRPALESAIEKVRLSFEAARVSSYVYSGGSGSILVQCMVPAEFSGVLFTRDPGVGGLQMVELVKGTAENLVSGTARPQTFRFGRVSKSLVGENQPPIDLAPLLALGDKAVELFGRPQDIEWTYVGGEFYLVQSRDITRPVGGETDAAIVQNEYARVIELAKEASSEEIVFGKNELSEMIPRPTPLSLSLMEAFWASGGSVDRAASELGLNYRIAEGSNHLTTVLGRLYINKRAEKDRVLAVGPLSMRRLVRDADRIERDFRESFLPRFLNETRLTSVADFEKLSTEELVAEVNHLYRRLIHDTHVSVDVVNIAAGIYLDRARRALEEAHIDPSGLLGHIPETVEGKAITEIAATHSKSRRWLMLKHFGHRAVLDYELADPRYSEDFNRLNRMIAGREQAARAPYQAMPALSKSLARVVDVARRFQTLKEDAKHHSLIELAILRRALLALDRRFGLDGRVFQLRFEEVLSIGGHNAENMRALAKRREDEAEILRREPALASTLTIMDLEAASAGHRKSAHSESGAISGTRVSGTKIVEGRARVVTEADAEEGRALEDFQDGDILVTPMVNPAWLPYFSRAGGFVSEVGGWLSHPAILAREYDVAMIVGTHGMAAIADGCRLRLHLDGQIEIVTDQETVEAAA